MTSLDDYGVERPNRPEEVPGLAPVPRETNDLRRSRQQEGRKRKRPGAGGAGRPGAAPSGAGPAKAPAPGPKPVAADDSHVDTYA